jgi:hypothetical protein
MSRAGPPTADELTAAVDDLLTHLGPCGCGETRKD